MQESAAAASPSPITAVCILGMHRGGTSALAGLLNLLGVDLGRNLIPPGPDNPKGFWEQSQIVSWHMGLLDALGSFSEDFLPLPDQWEDKPQVAPYHDYMLALLRAEFSGRPFWGFKDPRTCRTLPLWHKLFDALAMQPRYVLMVRSPGEVADSLGARTGCPYNQALLMGLGHVLEAERHTRGRSRVLVAYDNLMADWKGQVQRIAQSLEFQWPRSPDQAAALAARLVDPALRHFRAADPAGAEAAAREAGADPVIAMWAFTVHHVLAAGAQGQPMDQTALDQIGYEFRKAAPALLGWRPRKLKAPTVAAGNR